MGDVARGSLLLKTVTERSATGEGVIGSVEAGRFRGGERRNDAGVLLADEASEAVEELAT